MPATIHRFRSRRDRLSEEESARLREALLDAQYKLDLADEPVGRIVAEIDRQTAGRKGWSFVMLSPSQNALVVQRLAAESKRSKLAMLVWAECFTGLQMDTAEVRLTRGQLAERVGALPRDVSSVLSELVRIGALSRRRDGRVMRYFMNPHVGTTLPEAAGEKARASAAPVQLALVEPSPAS